MIARFTWLVLGLVGLIAFLRLCQLVAGPMLRYQLVQLSRRPRFYLVRFGYGALLLGLLLAAYVSRSSSLSHQSKSGVLESNFATIGLAGTWSDLALQYRENARFATGFFFLYTIVQYVLLLVLTPAFMAGVLTEQKERKTFHILFTTDLSSLEMVFGLFVSRLSLLGMIFVAGLPAIPLLEFLGSVDPSMIWCCTIALLITIVSVGSLSALNSVLCKDSMDAILGTYILIAIYLLLSALGRLLLLPTLGLATFPSTQTWQSPVTLAEAVRWLDSGNLAIAAYDLIYPVRYAMDVGLLVRQRLFDYAIFHALVSVVCCSLTVLLLRRKALAEARAGERQAQSSGFQKLFLEAWPLFWLECHLASPRSRRWTSRLLAGCGIALLFFLPIHLDYFFGRLAPSESDVRLSGLLSLWARPVAAFLGTLLLVQSAVRASGSVVRDRVAQTGDALLLLPLSNASILSAKWLASLMGSRRTWTVLFLLASYGLFAGVIHPFGIACFIAVWLAGSLFVTSLGLWMSIECPNARIATVLTLVIAGAAMLVIAFNPEWLTSMGFSEFERRAFVPPTAFFDLLFSADQYRSWARQPDSLHLKTLFTELAIWILASLGVLELALIRFRRKTGRKSSSKSGTARVFGSNQHWTWREVGSAVWTAARLGYQDLCRMTGHATVFLLPPAGLCLVYLLLGWRNASNLTRVIRALDVQEPQWRQADNPSAATRSARNDNDSESQRVAREVGQVFLQEQGQAFEFAAAGKMDEALQACDATLRWVDTQESESVFARLSKRQSMQSRVYSGMEAILAGGIASEATLTRLIDRITEEDRYPYVPVAVRGARQEFDARMAFLERGHTPQESELRLPQQTLLRLRRQNDPFAALPSMNEASWFELPAGLPALPNVEEFEFLLQQALPRQHALGLQAATEAIDIWSQSRDQRMASAEEAGRSNFTSFDSAGFESAITAWELIATERQTILAALLVERYRLKHSAWPESPADVARETGRSFPPDPCRKGSLQYRKLATGVVVYSIGFDGVDNGGKLFKGHVFPPAGFDIGVRLPNPDQRKFVMPASDVEDQQPPRGLDRLLAPVISPARRGNSSPN
jgi:hypothetical protein